MTSPLDHPECVLSVMVIELTQYQNNTVQKLGAFKPNCPLPKSEQIVSSTMCPLVCHGNLTMSHIEVYLINQTACTPQSRYNWNPTKVSRKLFGFSYTGLRKEIALRSWNSRWDFPSLAVHRQATLPGSTKGQLSKHRPFFCPPGPVFI